MRSFQTCRRRADVSDYLATHTKDELIAVLKAAVEYDVLMFAGHQRSAPAPANPAPDVAPHTPAVTGDPVALAPLLDSIADFMREYIIIDDESLWMLALWVAHTHSFDACESTPYIHIKSATKESGKTRVLEVLQWLVAKPWFTARVSAAVMIRKIAAEMPTLLLDESDAAFSGDAEYTEALRGALNAGYRRGGCHSMCVGTSANLKPKDFSVFGPKAIAGIGRLE